MSDEIDADMRALIDAAVSEGRVRTIPRGQSGDVVQKPTAGRPKDHATIRKVKLLADMRMTDGEIADRIGKTQKAVSNCRYRHGIENGFVKRRNGG